MITEQPDPGGDPFEKFLLWLSADRENALRRYGDIMAMIARYFVRKSCPESEEMASETRDRVVKIIASGKVYPNAEALFYSVADKVWKEDLRKPKPEALPADDRLPVLPQDTERKELRSRCLDQCLALLPDSDRDLITRYYLGRGTDAIENRKQLTAEHGIENTLRVRAFRIRAKLRICMEACMRESGK